MYLRVFNKPTLVLNSVEAARDLLDKRSSKYSDRPHFILLVDMSVCNSMDTSLITLTFAEGSAPIPTQPLCRMALGGDNTECGYTQD